MTPSATMIDAKALDASESDVDRVAVVADDDGRIVCERCHVAQSPRARMRGLLGRRGLARGEGMLLRPAPSIHTFFMRFPIDVVFLDWDLRVLRVESGLRPWRAAGCRGARTVLELAAGEAVRRSIRPGQRLRLVDAPQEEEAPRPATRVVVAGSDRRFLRVTSYLLSRVGFAVDSVRSLPAVVPALEQARADILIVDASEAVTAAVRTVAAVQALHPTVAVVVVADSAPLELGSIPVLPKWSTFNDLAEAISDAIVRAGEGSTGNGSR